MEYDDIDEDIERLNIILQDEEDGEDDESDGELRVLENNEEEYYSNASRPSTSSDVTASSFPTTSICTDVDDALFKFDPNTITSETCLAMNRAYQEVLLDTLRQIEISLMENRAHQRKLEESVSEKVKKTDKQTIKDTIEYKSCPGTLPFFRDKSMNIPAYNEDVKLKEKMNEEKQHVKPKVAWSKLERKDLVDAVKLNALEQAVRPLLNKQEVEMEKLSRCKNSEEIAEAKERIKKIQEDIKQKQMSTDDELWKSCDNSKIDFLKISCVNFSGKYSPSECESMWNTVLRPDINRSKWTPGEEQKLIALTEKYNMRNWEQIAKELKTNRTPYQCLQHYKQNIFVSNESEWTTEEDELLKEVVETCSHGRGRVRWYQVAYYIDGRSADQCYARWNRIDPKKVFGRWTTEEDKQLLDAVQQQGGMNSAVNWTKIQEHVPSRNARQCRERFIVHLSSDMLYKQWTYEDDKKLLELYEQHGASWVQIAKHFDCRTDNMVLLRHKRLVKWQRLSEGFYSQPKKVQKEMKNVAFRFLKTGEVVPKEGLSLRVGKTGSIRLSEKPIPKKKYKTEIEKLKDLGGRNSDESDDDNNDNNDDDNDENDHFEDVDDDDDDDEEMTKSKRVLQDSLDAFLALYNIEALDYYKQIVDKNKGGLVVPRPPPLKRNKIKHSLSLWNKQEKLHQVVASQIDAYVEQFQDQVIDTEDDSNTKMNLYEQISKNVKIGDEEEKKRMIKEAFRGKNPGLLSVRELLNISRCMKEHGKPPKNPKEFDKKPWEVETSEEEAESSDTEEEFPTVEGEEPKKKRSLTEPQKEHLKSLNMSQKKYHDLMYQIKEIVLSKMDPKEVNRRGRKKLFLMYPKKILMKYRGLDEERRLNRKSLVLLMKTLDVNSRKAYFKAKKGKRRLSALAFLKTAEKANLKRAKTRRQKKEIQETAQIETNMNSELSEVSDYLLDIKDELKIEVDDNEENIEEMMATMEEDDPNQQPHYGFDKTLPYIPPNRTNLLGMKTLLMEHRYLIDQADMYFNIEELKQKLYDLRKKGPNPLMSVISAIRKTESAARKRSDKNFTSKLNEKDCKKQMDEIRKTTAYLKLKARFQSMFTWPALLSTIYPPKGKPLPLALHELKQKSNVTELDAQNVLAEQNEEAVEEVDNNAEEEEEENLPEEEAVEKLVDKIMEEYEKERSKRKRTSTAKKFRKFSEKRKRSFVEKERTKILKKLGLYEKMQEFKRRRLEAAENDPSSSVTSTSATSTVTSSTVTSTDVLPSVPELPETSAVNTTSITITNITSGQQVLDAPATSNVNTSTVTITNVTSGLPELDVSANSDLNASTITITNVTSGQQILNVPATVNLNSSTTATTINSAISDPSMPDLSITPLSTNALPGPLNATLPTETPEIKIEMVNDTKLPTSMPVMHNSSDLAVQDGVKNGESMNLTEGCQANFPLDNTNSEGSTENVLKRKKPGRPAGSKAKNYGTAVRKSKRRVDTEVVIKREQDYEMSPPKKKTQSSKRGSQYNLVRSLIPDKMSKIASQISELPIMNEPLPEKPVKSLRRPKQEKPPKERMRVQKSKFSQDFVTLMKQQKQLSDQGKSHKTDRVLKSLKESGGIASTSSIPDGLIKTEPLDSSEEESAVDSVSYTITVNELDNSESIPSENVIPINIGAPRAETIESAERVIPRKSSKTVRKCLPRSQDISHKSKTVNIGTQAESIEPAEEIKPSKKSAYTGRKSFPKCQDVGHNSKTVNIGTQAESIEPAEGIKPSKKSADTGRKGLPNNQDVGHNSKTVNIGTQAKSIEPVEGIKPSKKRAETGRKSLPNNQDVGHNSKTVNIGAPATETIEPVERIKPRKEDVERARKSLQNNQDISGNTARKSLADNQGIGNTSKTVNFEQKSTETLSKDKALEQNIPDDNTKGANNATVGNTQEPPGHATGPKPLIIAVPVMIAGVQQVAFIPFLPDEEGKITLPNGKKIDASSASNSSGAPSIPMVNFDQPFQFMSPSQPSSSNLVSANEKQQPSTVGQTQKNSEPSETVVMPKGSVSLLKPRPT